MPRSNDLDRERGGADDGPLSSSAVSSPRAFLAPGARRFLTGWTALAAPVLGWGALRLPWRPEAPLALVLWALAAANLCTLVALLGSGRRLRLALGVLVALSLGAAPLLTGAIISTSVVMVRMYGALGWGLTVALAAIGWLLLLATLPVALFGLHLSYRGGDALRRREASDGLQHGA
jgi:hypothetical protein